MAIGRISGPLLKANLIRNGVDLAFETDLLYLNVTSSQIGVNTAAPEYDLDVNGTIRSTNAQIDNQLNIADLIFADNKISSSTNSIVFEAAPTESITFLSKIVVDDIEIENNSISTATTNANLELEANGAGTIEFLSDTNITGNLDVTGNITMDGNLVIGGNITIGDETTDSITIIAKIESNLVPKEDVTYDLGSPTQRWRAVYAGEVVTPALTLPELAIGDLQFQGNEISSTTNQDIVIGASGTGGVSLGNFRFVSNTITNISPDAVSVIEQTGIGYFKIDTTNGFVFPVGTTAQRPTAYAVVGMTRYNSQLQALEIWNGNAWTGPAGATAAVTITLAEEIAARFALTLG